MKARLFTRQGVTLLLGDAVGKNPDGSPITIADMQRLLGRGDLCIGNGDPEPAAPVYEASAHAQAGVATNLAAKPPK